MSSFSCVSVHALRTHFICVGIFVRVSIVADILLSNRLSPPDLLYIHCMLQKKIIFCVSGEKAIAAQMGFSQPYCYESGSHSLKLHITLGLHFPSCTALTHSRPPLHQSHSCHHSLINSDCLTTPAPHSLTHIKAAHKHSPSAKSCFALATFLSVLPCICYLCVWPRTARPSISEPVPVTSTPAWYCLRLCFASDIPVFACWPLPVWFCSA